VATTLALNEAGFRTHGLYFYSVIPDSDGRLLSFEEDYLAYAEGALFDGRRIIRLPSPWLIGAIRTGLLQSPDRIPVCLALKKSLPPVGYFALHDVARYQLGAPELPVAIGTRASDSPGRRINLQKSGPIDVGNRTFSPIAAWGRREVLDIIRRHELRLPAEYRWQANTWDGLDHKHLAGIAEHRPADYARILQVFPLAGAALFRANMIRQRQEAGSR
jgi:phosphoadenosine phosphosulfate reductase